MKKKQNREKTKQLLVSVTKLREATQVSDEKLKEVAGGFGCPRSQIPCP